MKVDIFNTDKKYNIIYADPPWQYKTWSKKGQGRSAEHHYPTMPIDEIKKLRIQDVSDDNCIMFLWATFPCLVEALELIKAWGFTYKSIGFVWVKKNKKADTYFWGLGHYTRSNAEICLIATKGSVKRISKSVHSIVDAPLRKHSQKPYEVRNKIFQLVGDLPRIELFAREEVSGWDCWGNEV